MAYIIKNTSGLVNTRLTDVGRRNISQGNFNISYFQIGDSEVNYTAVPNYNQVNNNILMPAFNAQNDTGFPESNKQNIKYPYYVSGGQGSTYGIPYMDSVVDEVYNSAGPKGFFTGNTVNGWTAQTSSAYTITSNYYVELDSLSGQTNLNILLDPAICASTTGTPSVNDFVTIILDGIGGCGNVNTNPILTYKIQSMSPTTGTTGTTGYTLTLDRTVPDYSSIASPGEFARVLIYPSGMTVLYDFITPAPFWETDALNFESPCDVTNRENTLIWNMNIPWSENPAGLLPNTYEDYADYGSVTYIGTKEYLGYQEATGQTDTSEVYYYNSFDEKVIVYPKDQKAIAIIHYTNQDIDNVYGEKFSTVPFDPQNPTDTIGLARHFKLSIPTLMWHKSTGNTIGETFFIDPPNYDLCTPYFIKSTRNLDMNDPGIRYYHLWDTNPDSNGNLNRIGKVFPDQQIVIIDDEEVIAALSYKSNRNWTLPAPKVATLTPNTCFTNTTSTGLLTNPEERLWVTYRFGSTAFTESLHCNYYTVLKAPDTVTANTVNVSVRFGDEFPFLNDNFNSTNLTGYCANSIQLVYQIVTGDTRPVSSNWRISDVTSDISATTVNGFITLSGLTGTTFQIDPTMYNSATFPYNLNNYIDLPTNAQPDVLNFGDEFYFYGNIETDISATIYEMKYLINLGRNQFTNTSNPTWTSGTTSYVTEIGLYDDNKDLIVISKLQSPELRQGIQQYVVKLDF
jgi:hypothetical protein